LKHQVPSSSSQAAISRAVTVSYIRWVSFVCLPVRAFRTSATWSLVIHHNYFIVVPLKNTITTVFSVHYYSTVPYVMPPTMEVRNLSAIHRMFTYYLYGKFNSVFKPLYKEAVHISKQ